MQGQSQIHLQPGSHTWIPNAEQASSPWCLLGAQTWSLLWGDLAPPGQGATQGSQGPLLPSSKAN